MRHRKIPQDLPDGVREMGVEEQQTQAFFNKFSLPARPCGHLKYRELPAFNARSAFLTDKVFDVGDRPVDDDDCRRLATALTLLQPPQLRQLHLQRCSVGDGFGAVIEALAAVPSLELVFAPQNQIGDTAMLAFDSLAAAGAPVGLKKLALPTNRIGDAGVLSLVHALRAAMLPELEYLFLAENQIGDSSVVPLAEALGAGACPRLSRLSLQDNRLTDTSLAALAGALTRGAFEHGEYIYVQDNPFTDVGREALSAAIAGHPNLLQGHFGWPPPLPRQQLLRQAKAEKEAVHTQPKIAQMPYRFPKARVPLDVTAIAQAAAEPGRPPNLAANCGSAAPSVAASADPSRAEVPDDFFERLLAM
jgi:hypothetical protein